MNSDDIWGQTDRLLLRKINFTDFENIAEIMRGNNVQKIWEHYFSDSDVNNWIEKCRQFYNSYNCGYFLALTKATNEIVGQIGLMPDFIDGKMYYEIGYILKEQYERNGFATEGASFMADYALNKLHLSEVIFEIRPCNQKSIKVTKRLGAIQEGSFIKNVRGKDMEHLIFVLKRYNKNS